MENDRRAQAPAAPERIKRLWALSRLLDSSIPLPGGYRIGLDGLIGLIPGIGDLAGGIASSYLIIEASRLGASTFTLLRMVGNVLLESLVGMIPIVGDLFDFVWKANLRNMDLLERQLANPKLTGRPEQRLKLAVFIMLLIMFVIIAGLAYLSFNLLLLLIEALRGGAPAL